jgi:hypothetical protein
MVFFPAQSTKKLLKNILKLGSKIYVLQYTLYVHKNVRYILDFQKIYYTMKVFQKYSELCLPVKTLQVEEGGGEGL